MQTGKQLLFLAAMILSFTDAVGQDSPKTHIVMEFDAIAAMAGANEKDVSGFSTDQFGMSWDFPMGPSWSTGPEFWGATYTAKGTSDTSSLRREDLFPGEKHEIEAIRLKWNFTHWEHPSGMTGRYWRLSYGYRRIHSKANRYTEDVDDTTNLPTNLASADPTDEIDLITDTRHSLTASLGNRWIAYGMAWAVGIGLEKDFTRTVDIDSTDTRAERDYEAVINTLSLSRLRVAVVPELHFSLGFSF